MWPVLLKGVDGHLYLPYWWYYLSQIWVIVSVFPGVTLVWIHTCVAYMYLWTVWALLQVTLPNPVKNDKWIAEVCFLLDISTVVFPCLVRILKNCMLYCSFRKIHWKTPLALQTKCLQMHLITQQRGEVDSSWKYFHVPSCPLPNKKPKQTIP